MTRQCSRQPFPRSVAIMVCLTTIIVGSAECIAQPLERGMWYRVIPGTSATTTPARAQMVPVGATLQRNELRFRKDSGNAIMERQGNTLLWKLPGFVQAVDNSGRKVDCVPRVLLDADAAVWDPRKREYVGQFSVGLAVRDDNTVSTRLSTGVPLQLSGNATSYSSERSWIWNHTGFPYKSIAIGARVGSVVPDNVIRLVVMAVTESNAYTLNVPLKGDPIILSPTETQEVDGWGVGEATFSVKGPPPSSGEPITIPFAASGLIPSALNAPLDSSGSGIAVFRTSWKSGVIPVSATYESFVASSQVRVNRPYRFFLLVFVGGLMGAIVSKKKIAWRLIGPGVLGGVVAAVLSVTGMLKLIVASGGYLPIVAFVVAVIGGWGGDKTLNWIRDLFFPTANITAAK